MRIWEDMWVPGLCSFKISSPRRELQKFATVNQLMSYVSGSWNEWLVRQIFCNNPPIKVGAIE